MTPLVPIAMFGWIPAVLVMFALLPPRQAVLVAFLAAWMFLPIVSYPLAGLPDYTKTSATCTGVILAATLFDASRVLSFRPRLVDIPMLVWCLIPFVSSMLNDYGPYDGLSGTVRQTVAWGFPYFIGRVYLSDLASLRMYAIALAIGGLVYTPLVLLEVRMSPQLHTWVYGFHQHTFAQSRRMGGWRPTVFMPHGLIVSMFMTTAALAAFALWLWGSAKSILRVPLPVLVVVLIGTAVLCKSANAMMLLFVGLVVLSVSRFFRTRLLIAGMLVVPAAYMTLRTVGGWDGQELLDLSVAIFGSEREDSLAVRLHSENILWSLVQGKVLLGTGRWTWARALAGQQYALIPDGMWIIALGKHGLVGIAALTCALLLPAARMLKNFPPRFWQSPLVAAPIFVALMVTLQMFDNLLNADENPLVWLAAGGIAGLARPASPKPASAASPIPEPPPTRDPPEPPA